MCGAINEMTQHIQLYLQHIPMLDRCSEVVKNKQLLPAVYEVKPPRRIYTLSACN